MKTENIVRRAFGAAVIAVIVSGIAGCGGPNAAESAGAPEAVTKIATTTGDAKSEAKNAEGKGIAWATSFEAARAQAKAQNKALMIDFYTDWCSACKMLDAEIYPQADVVKASRNFVNVKVNAEKRTDIANQYGIAAFPTIIWIRADGVPVLRQDGITEKSSEFAAQMDNAHARFLALQK